jgi:hypothetical protein
LSKVSRRGITVTLKIISGRLSYFILRKLQILLQKKIKSSPKEPKVCQVEIYLGAGIS